jgi:acetyltransferase-like isoleucine patch superfamily enzyme
LSNTPRCSEAGIVDVEFGVDVRIVRPVNLYGCRIGDRSFVGPFVEIQSGAVVGRDCRIQSHSFICDLVTIGDGSFIGHGVKFVNDSFASGGPAGRDRSKWGSTTVGNNVSIGSNATVLPVSITDGVVVGAGTVVTRDLVVKGIYAGNPARLLRTL